MGMAEVPVLDVEEVPPGKRNYTLDEQFCRLGAHQSVVLKNERRHELVVSDGTAVFRWVVNGTEYRIGDLNPYVVRIDLSKPFSTDNIPFIQQIKKNTTIPVTNRGVLSTDASQDRIYVSHGHFYDKEPYRGSEYFVKKEDIPGDEVWSYDLNGDTGQEWKNVSFSGSEGRRYGCASLSVPEEGKSYCLGGLQTPRVRKDAEDNVFIPQPGMLEYNYADQSIKELDITTPDDPRGDSSYWHGTLEHLKVGCGKGFLLSLMAEHGTALKPYPYSPNISLDLGDSTTDFRSISIYNLDTQKWSTQPTGWINNLEPILRTRFCSALRYSASTDTWEYWLFGGQLRRDQTQGVGKLYVLSMPSFIWTEVTLPSLGDEKSQWVRSHTCHPVGSQLLVVGGWEPGDVLSPNVSCDQSLVRVIDLNGPALKGGYEVDTEYATPEQVIVGAELDSVNRRSPAYGNGWADGDLERAFGERCGGEGGLEAGEIAGIVVAARFVGILMLVLGWKWWKGWRWVYVWRKRTPKVVEEESGVGGLEVVQQGGGSVRGVMGRRSANASRVEMAVPGQMTPHITGINGEDEKILQVPANGAITMQEV